MTANKALIALALGLALTACNIPEQPTNPQQQAAVAEAASAPHVEVRNGLEYRVERFTKPDEYGVICYQDINSSRNLSCVQVQGKAP